MTHGLVGTKIRYSHRSQNHFNETFEVQSHAEKGTGFVAGSAGNGTAHYYEEEDIESIIVALVASVGYLDEPKDGIEGVRQDLIATFIESFRESMVPTFREELRRIVNEAEDDWSAKCQASDMINRYENLR